MRGGLRGGLGQRSWWRSLGEADRGVLVRFGTEALTEVECLEPGLGILRVVFGDIVCTEYVAAINEAMVCVVAQGACCGSLFH